MLLDESDGSGGDGQAQERQFDLLALDEALEQLQVLNQRQARTIELRYFAGLTVEETADVLEVSPRTVRADSQIARRWLERAMDAS